MRSLILSRLRFDKFFKLRVDPYKLKELWIPLFMAIFVLYQDLIVLNQLIDIHLMLNFVELCKVGQFILKLN
jgi:hypothetical protein